MKKKLVATLMCVAVATSLIACGSKTDEVETQASESVTEVVESETQTENAEVTLPEVASSMSYDLDVLSLVSELADYSNVEVSLTGDYEVPQEYIDSALSTLLASVGLDYMEVTDRDDVQEGDVANIDYEGYLNDVAFEGGTAQGTDLGIGSGTFIPGFEEGLIGAKVGETVTIDVTFPENYGNADLAGQPTKFVVTINSIKTPTTLEMVTDEMVAANFAENYGLTTVDQLVDYATGYVEEQAVTSSIIEYMMNNSTVTVPEDYLYSRAYEAVETQVGYYYGVDLATFSQMLESSGMTLDQYIENSKESMIETIEQELIFEAIGLKEGFDLDQESYATFIQKNLDASAMTSEDELYEALGDGNKEYGQKYAKRMHLMNAALDLLKKNATISNAKVYIYQEK